MRPSHAVGFVLIAAALVATALVHFGGAPSIPWGDRTALADLVETTCSRVLGSARACYVGRELAGDYVWTLLVIPAVLVFELVLPVDRSQRVASGGLRQDVLWFLQTGAFRTLVLSIYVAWLSRMCGAHLEFLRVEAVAGLPVYAQVVVVVLVGDFLAWLHHLVRHKVPLFWEFHKVHHSQTELNAFTDLRVHPLDDLVAVTISFIPFFSLTPEVAPPAFVAWSVFTNWQTKFYHANVRTNFGWLRYVLVTPQSHRVHHGRDRVYRDSNFGVIFSIWDLLLGTQYRRYDVYPPTGVDDPRFPVEQSTAARATVRAFFAQLRYPFVAPFRRG